MAEAGKVTGIITNVIDSSFNGTDGLVKKLTVIIEYAQPDQKYPKQYAIDFIKPKQAMINNAIEGALVEATYYGESREYNGKWYSNLNGTFLGDLNSTAPKESKPFTNTTVTEVLDDDLPF